MPLAAGLLQAGARVNVVDAKDRTPLFFAVRRNDIKAIKLLIDFGADVNIPTNNMSLLAIASQYGYANAVHMLIEAGARTDVGTIPPLIALLKSGSLPCLIELLKKKPSEILSIYNEKPILYHAIEEKTTLLPVIALKAKEETNKMKQDGDINTPPFPPVGLTPAQLKRLNTALEKGETVISQTEERYDDVISIWKQISIHDIQSTIQPEFVSVDTDDDTPFDIPDTPIRNGIDEYIESSDINMLSTSSIEPKTMLNIDSIHDDNEQDFYDE